MFGTRVKLKVVLMMMIIVMPCRNLLLYKTVWLYFPQYIRNTCVILQKSSKPMPFYVGDYYCCKQQAGLTKYH